MYRLIIVDDEWEALKGMRDTLPWEQWGFEVAGAASSGEEAWSLVETILPDVLLTDISMPEMSGLELIRLAKELQPRIKTVVISGYSEFDYAIEAIKLKVENYILKPLDPKKITEIFEGLKTQIDEENRNEQKEQYLQSEYEMLRGVDAEHKGFQEEYQAQLIRLLEEGRYSEMDAFAEELFTFLEQGKIDIRDYCLKALRNAALYFHLENPPLFSIYRLKPGAPEYIEEGKGRFREDLQLLVAQLRDTSESTAILVSSQARRYIELNYRDKNLSLREAADHLGVSYGYLSTAFARTYGKNFKAYLTSMRIERARELLMERKYNIYEIADMTGYGSSRYFTEAFKRRYGISPVDYLSRLNGGMESEPDE